MLKIIFLLLLSNLFISQFSFAQSVLITGKVANAVTNQPLAFVNIGIPGKGTGTVSDEEGLFSLNINTENGNDCLRFSMIGYESKSFLIREIKQTAGTIYLNEKAYQLREVVVSGKKEEADTLGSKIISPKAHYYFTSRALGSELGRVIKIRKAPAKLQTLSFNIKRTDFDSVTFRINIYNIKNKKPGNNLLSQNIIFTTAAKDGEVSINLNKYEIIVKEDFIITLESLKIFGEKKETDVFYFSAEMPGEGFGKLASQDKWRKVKTATIFFKLGVKYI